jgi:hypothetical protein
MPFFLLKKPLYFPTCGSFAFSTTDFEQQVKKLVYVTGIWFPCLPIKNFPAWSAEAVKGFGGALKHKC